MIVLSEHDVRELLDMESCIEAMTEVLASLARGELYNPLRSIARAEGADTLLGLMPAYRAAPTKAYGLKEIVIVPTNPSRGLDTHMGGVLLHDGDTGELRRDHERVADHGDPHGRRLRRRDAGARASGRAAGRDPRLRRTGTRPRPLDARRPRRPGDPHLVAQPREGGGARGRGRRHGRAVRSMRPSSAPRSCARRPRRSSRSSSAAGSRAART